MSTMALARSLMKRWYCSESDRLPLSAANLLGQVVGLAELADQLELGLEPIGVILFAREYPLEQIPGAVIVLGHAQGDAPVQSGDGLALQIEAEGQLFDGRLSDLHRSQPLQVGVALQVQDPLDELVGILHLADRLVTEPLTQALVSPVVEHLCIQEVLVDRGELCREHLIEQFDDALVTVHRCSPPTVWLWLWLWSCRDRMPRTARTGRSTVQAAELAAGSRSGSAASMSAWRAPWHSPHPPPARHRAVTSATVRTPEAIAASMVRSVIASQWHTYMALTPHWLGGGHVG